MLKLSRQQKKIEEEEQVILSNVIIIVICYCFTLKKENSVQRIWNLWHQENWAPNLFA